jgi:hypothetical protein
MEPKIKRKFRSFGVSLTTSEPTSLAIRVDDVAGGGLVMGTVATSATTLAVWGAADTVGPFGLLRDRDGDAVDIKLSSSTSQARVYPFPDECYGLGAIKIVANQTAATSAACIVMLKG